LFSIPLGKPISKKKMRNLLKIVLLLDALITIGFGVFSWLSPLDTFGTIIAIPETNNSLELAILSSMSVLYILLGLIALIGIRANYPTIIWIGLLMLLRHSWLGTMKVMDIGEEWLIGNPYPDIIIHSFFAAFYLLGIYLMAKSRK